MQVTYIEVHLVWRIGLHSSSINSGHCGRKFLLLNLCQRPKAMPAAQEDEIPTPHPGTQHPKECPPIAVFSPAISNEEQPAHHLDVGRIMKHDCGLSDDCFISLENELDKAKSYRTFKVPPQAVSEFYRSQRRLRHAHAGTTGQGGTGARRPPAPGRRRPSSSGCWC